jgi:hypothetical protein
VQPDSRGPRISAKIGTGDSRAIAGDDTLAKKIRPRDWVFGS